MKTDLSFDPSVTQKIFQTLWVSQTFQFLVWALPIDLIKSSSNPLGGEGVFSYGACVASHADTLSGGSPAKSELTSMAR